MGFFFPMPPKKKLFYHGKAFPCAQAGGHGFFGFEKTPKTWGELKEFLF